MFPLQTLASTGKIPKRCSRSWLPLSQRGDRSATAHRGVLNISRIPCSRCSVGTRFGVTGARVHECNLDDHIPNVRSCIKSKVSSHYYSRLQKGIGATARANRNVEARTSHTWHPREAPQTDSQPCQTTVLGINGTAALSQTSLPKPLLRSLGPPEEPRFCAIPFNPKCDRRSRDCPRILICGQNKSH